MRMWPALWMTAAFSLAGCQTTQTVSGCPPLPQYSVQRQRQMAAELRALPPGSHLAELIRDYKRLRDACRI